MKNLTKKSFKAGSWLFGHTVFARVSGLLKIAVIARILTPKQFGIYGIATLALNFLETFSETSIDQALIQREKLSDKDISTAWFTSIIRGIIISLILYVSAPFVSKFFNQPSSSLYIRIIALTPLIRNFSNPQINKYRKKLNFKPEFWQRTISTIAELISALSFAFIYKDPRALVYAMVIGAIVEVIVSFITMPAPKSIKPNKKIFKELINFSKWLWGSSIVSYLVLQGDDWVVGKLLGVTQLGLYQNAYKIASLPATQVTGIASQITYPAFSSIQKDKDRLKRAFKKTVSSISVFGTLVAIGIFIFAKPLTLIVLGSQWLELVPALRVLGIYSVLAALGTSFGPLFKAVGQPQAITIFGIIRLSVLAIIIIPFTKSMGIVGASWATVIAALSPQPYLFYKLHQILKK